MAAFNAELLRVCSTQGVECADLAAALSGDTTAMYDDMHFTEQGARLVAARLADGLRGILLPDPDARTMNGPRPHSNP